MEASPYNSTTNLSRLPCKYEEGSQCYYSDEHLLTEIHAFIKPQPHEWFYCALFILVFLFGVCGNGLVCFAVWTNVHLRTTTNVFLVNLAIADLLVIILCLPPTFAQTFWETWFLGDAMCRIVEFYQSVSVIVSVLTLTAISVERWFAICRPMTFKETRTHVVITIIFIWVTGHLSSIPRLLIFAEVSDSMIPRNLTILLTSCIPVDHYAAFVNEIVCFVVFYILPIIIMGYTYLSIAFSLWSSIKTGKTLTEGMQDKITSQLKARRRVAKMLIVVVIVFILCFLPVYVWNILRLIKHPIVRYAPTTVAYAVHLLIYVNSSINPVIYNFMSGKFRKEFYQACFCCFRRGKENAKGTYSASHEMEQLHYKSGTNNRTEATDLSKTLDIPEVEDLMKSTNRH